MTDPRKAWFNREFKANIIDLSRSETGDWIGKFEVFHLRAPHLFGKTIEARADVDEFEEGTDPVNVLTFLWASIEPELLNECKSFMEVYNEQKDALL